MNLEQQLSSELSDAIVNLVDHADELTRSDLQGAADALALRAVRACIEFRAEAGDE